MIIEPFILTFGTIFRIWHNIGNIANSKTKTVTKLHTFKNFILNGPQQNEGFMTFTVAKDSEIQFYVELIFMYSYEDDFRVR